MATDEQQPHNPLASFSACEISDALIKLGSPNGGHITDIRMLSPPLPPSAADTPAEHTISSNNTICGAAYTVQMVRSSDIDAPKLSEHFVDTAPANCIIVISAPPEARNAVWGGLMSAGAKAKGCKGVIISGRCRDLSEHRSIGFPVFARGQSTVGQSPFTRPSQINIPLTIYSPDHDSLVSPEFRKVLVNPGDTMVADQDGVVCVPKHLELQVATLAARQREIDAKCMADIEKGLGVQASFKLHRGK